MSSNRDNIVGTGLDSCWPGEFRFCCSACKRSYASVGFSTIWEYKFSSLSHGVAFAEIKISLVMGLPVAWSAWLAPTGTKGLVSVGGEIVVTNESIESIQMKAANCIYGPGPLSQVVCSTLSQCDEEHRKKQAKGQVV